MRKHLLYIFYAATSFFIVLALQQDITRILQANSATEPQYVFKTKSDDNAEKRKQQELEMIRQWAEDFDPGTIKQ